MAPQNSDDYTPAEGLVRFSRHLSRQDILNEKRLRNTDILPSIEGDVAQNAGITRQAIQLRDENRRLRKELEFLQHRLAQQRDAEMRLEHEIETIHHGHQLEIDQYQSNLREMMEELNQKRDALQELEQRYQELYHSFNEAVEEEARKMVAEASHTMKLSPSHTPSILHDVVQTLEFQVKQAEDQHVAEIMALMRQTQRKNDQLAQELAHERESIALERQQLAARQNNLREQSARRQKYIEDSLRARYSGLIGVVSTGILVVCVFLQVLMIEYLKFPLYWSLITPIFLSALVAFGLARAGTRPGQRKAGQAQQNKKPV